MKNRILIGIFFFLFVLSTSGVFAAMVGNSRQGLPAISVTSQPGSTDENPGTHQGSGLCLRIFTANATVGFNGGNNLYRYADNNPMLFTDPLGLSSDPCEEYKSLVIAINKVSNKELFPVDTSFIQNAFAFLREKTDKGAALAIWYHHYFLPMKLETTGPWDQSFTQATRQFMSSNSTGHSSETFVANIFVSETNFPSDRYGQTDVTGLNMALVDGNNPKHAESSTYLARTIAHETGHLLTSLYDRFGYWDGLMRLGFGLEGFIPEDREAIFNKLRK